jgi:hypothetical protein
MKSQPFVHRGLYSLIVSIGLFTYIASDAVHAGRAGGGFNRGGDLNHNVDNNNRPNEYNRNIDNHNGEWVAPGTVVVPATGYDNNSSSCSTVQQCSSDGNCVQSQVCN